MTNSMRSVKTAANSQLICYLGRLNYNRQTIHL